jgi:hypothetical protein
MQINGVKIFDLDGSSYIYVRGDGTAIANATELKNAYNFAKTATPYGNALSDSNRFTVIVGAGIYANNVPSAINFDTNNINVVSLTGNSDVKISFGITITASESCDFVGLDCGNNRFEIFGNNEKNNFKFTNCLGGNGSFGHGSDGYLKITNSYFLNCNTTILDDGDNCFGGVIQGNTYENCKAGSNSFGLLTGAFVIENINDNRFINCVANENSFLSYDSLFGVDVFNNEFINCIALGSSFINLQNNIFVSVTNNIFRSCSVTESSLSRSFIACFSEVYNEQGQTISRNFFYDCISYNEESFIFCNLTLLEINGNAFYNCVMNDRRGFICIRYTYPEPSSFGVGVSMLVEQNIIDGCSGGSSSFCHFTSSVQGSSTVSSSGSVIDFSGNTIMNCKSGNGNSFIFAETPSVDPTSDWEHRIFDNKIINCSSNKNSFVYIVSINGGKVFIVNNLIDSCFSANERCYIYSRNVGGKNLEITDNLIRNSSSKNSNSFFVFENLIDPPKTEKNIIKDCVCKADFSFGIFDFASFFEDKIGEGILFMNCIAEYYAFIQTSTGSVLKYEATSINCLLKDSGFGTVPIQGGKVNYCNMLTGSISFAGGNQVRLCLDGSNTEINS